MKTVTLDDAVAQGMADALAVAGVSAGGHGAPGGGVAQYEMDWANPQKMNIPLKQEGTAAIHFKTGSNPSPANDMVRLVCSESVTTGATNPVSRIAALSKVAGDFDANLNPYLGQPGASTVTCQFTVKPTVAPYGYPALDPNTDYYLNVKVTPGSVADPNQDCSMVCELMKPGSGY